MNSVILKGKIADFELCDRAGKNVVILRLITKDAHLGESGQLVILKQLHQIIIRNCWQFSQSITKLPVGTTIEIKGHLESNSNLEFSKDSENCQNAVVCDPKFGYEIWINDGEQYFADTPKLIEEFKQQEDRQLTPLEINHIINSVANRTGLAGSQPNIPFSREEVNCIFTHKRNWGDGLWFYLEDGRIFDFNFDYIDEDVSLYSHKLTGNLYEEDQDLAFLDKAIKISTIKKILT